MVIAVLMVGAGVIIELCILMGAPLGYQDERGFHAGDNNAGHAEQSLRLKPAIILPALECIEFGSSVTGLLSLLNTERRLVRHRFPAVPGKPVHE